MLRKRNTMLCSACTGIISVVRKHPPGIWIGPKPTYFAYPESAVAWAGAHHAEDGAFYDAVQKNCYICSTIYRDCSHEIRSQAYIFHTFYRLQKVDSPSPQPQSDNCYELEFTTEVIHGDNLMAEEQVFDCSGVFKILPKQIISVSGEPLALTTNTFSGKCQSQVRQWLDCCQKHHTRCNQDWRTGSGSPTRLLHINPAGDQFRLEIFRNRTRPPKYVTLSHCWKAGTAVTLTNENLQQLSTQLHSINLLPQRFQDAMAIAKWMGISYIWIDALCIIQNSQGDWLAESASMGDIYTNSFCNIAATSADPLKGCFTDRLTYMVEPYPVPAPHLHSEERSYVIGYDDFWGNSLLDTYLHTRGWVLQERMLSPRTIHFGQEQMFWECRCEMACEAYPDGIPKQFRNRKMQMWRQADKILEPVSHDQSDVSILSQFLSKLGLDWLTPESKAEGRKWVYSVWSKIVEAYMECKLSIHEDKLVAISGIAQKVFEVTNERYLAGLWDNDMLPQSLLWYVLNRRQVDSTLSVRSASEGHYRAPSWSWASLEAKVVWNWPVKCDEILIKILRTKIEQPTGSNMARITSGQMAIQGYLFEAILRIASRDVNGNPEEDGLYTLEFHCQDQRTSDVSDLQRDTIEPIIYLDTPMAPKSDFMYVFLLPVCTEWQGRPGFGPTCLAGLLLTKTHTSTGCTTYERIGIFGLDHDHVHAMFRKGPGDNRTTRGKMEHMPRNDIVLL